MTYNLIKTAYAGSFTSDEEAEAAPLVGLLLDRGERQHRVHRAQDVLLDRRGVIYSSDGTGIWLLAQRKGDSQTSDSS